METNCERVHIEAGCQDTVTIRHVQVNEFQYKGIQHSFNSLQGLIDFIKKKGDPEKTVIFYNTKGLDIMSVYAILDDSVTDRLQDVVKYNFDLSYDFSQWYNLFGSQLSQKDFIEFLKCLPDGQLKDYESLLASVQKLKIATQITGDYEYEDDNNITIMFKAKDGEGSARLPKTLSIELYLLNESQYKQTIEIELKLIKPKSENEKPHFEIQCPKIKRYLDEAIKHAINNMKEQLNEFLIVAGKPDLRNK